MELTPFEFTTPIVDHSGRITGHRKGRGQHVLEHLGHGIVLDLVLAPGGRFLMGSPTGQGYDDERPQHQVVVAPFLMARHLLNQAQWEAVLGVRHRCRFPGETLPVDSVSWHQAQAFCLQLAEATGRAYGLASEAQWEYACRAGTGTPFSWGKTMTTDLANYNGEFTYASEPKGSYRHITTPEGTFPPNAFGLHDMHGNLWEWCADPWHGSYEGAPADGSVWEKSGESGYRVARGGSWHDTPQVCRSAVRLRHRADAADEIVGFRVVMRLPWSEIVE